MERHPHDGDDRDGTEPAAELEVRGAHEKVQSITAPCSFTTKPTSCFAIPELRFLPGSAEEEPFREKPR